MLFIIYVYKTEKRAEKIKRMIDEQILNFSKHKVMHDQVSKDIKETNEAIQIYKSTKLTDVEKGYIKHLLVKATLEKDELGRYKNTLGKNDYYLIKSIESKL